MGADMARLRGGAAKRSSFARRCNKGTAGLKPTLSFHAGTEDQMPDTLAKLRRELSIANRILANEDVVDAFGHISVRHPDDPERYLISRHRAAELVEPSDILEFTLDSQPVKPTDARIYSELVIHGETYKLRPDVHSIC